MTGMRAKTVFVGCALIASVFFLALTFDTQTKFAEKTHEDKLTAEVAAGKWAWQKYNCNDCHTILGIGGYYAPDVTKVTEYRDSEWMTRFIKDPEHVWPQARKMPNLHLADEEISAVIAFLEWVDHIDTNGWPPKPLTASSSAPQKKGEAIFKAQGCPACHRLNGVGGAVGPDLTKVGTRRDKAWIEDQLRNPKAHNPDSIMPSFAKLSGQDMEALAGYLASMK